MFVDKKNSAGVSEAQRKAVKLVQGGRASVSALLPALFAGFIGGVALQLQQPGLDAPQTLDAVAFYAACTGAAACALVLVLFISIRSVPAQANRVRSVPFWAALALSGLMAAALGFSLTAARAVNFQRSALSADLEGRDIAVTGRVLAMPQISEDGLRFRFQIESAQLKGSEQDLPGGLKADQTVNLPPQIYLGWYSGFGARTGKGPVRVPARVPLDTDGADIPDFLPELQRQPQVLKAGERWQMTVRLKAPHGNSNPFGFDYELWLWEQGLQAAGYVRAGLHDEAPLKLGDSWSHPVERARQAVREAIYERVENRQLAGVIAALVTGDQNAIERTDWDVFRATGVAHLMSISGLHITMFAWLASRVLAWLWRRSVKLTPAFCLAWPAASAGALGGLLLAALYALFSGWGVPAQRTIWMLAAVVLLRQGARQWPWPVVWLLAMFVVVVLDPWALMQAGFWLSFVAVGVLFATDSGAAYARSAWARGIFDAKNNQIGPGLPRRAAKMVLVALGSLLNTAREQWVVTLALTPLSLLLFNQVSLVGLLANALAIPWVTLVVTPMAMLGVLWPPFWDGAAWSVGLLAVFLRWLASWPFASLSVAAAPLWFAVAGVAGGALVATRLPWNWRLLGLPLMLPVLLWQPLRPPEGQFEILGADIGQGNAVLVRTASHGLLYDTGPRFSRESDAGSRVLVPLLRALGERIDILMLSHRDIDHIGGAPAVLAMQPQALLISSIEDGHELQAIRPSTRCVAGQHWRWDGIEFEVLHPAADAYDAVAKPNTMSCVLRISNGTHTALLAGDLEAGQELKLVTDTALKAKLKADFLLVPHHGSKTSSSAVFLDQVKPQFALAQAGYRNRFGHPVDSVLERYRERGIQVFKSPVCGAATWRSDLPGQMQCQRQQGLRYWHHRAEGPF
jgi:competence protein ComEC